MPHSLFNVGKPSTQSSTRVMSSIPKPKGPAVPNTPAQISSIMPGMKVHHDKFGTGKVLNIEGEGDSRKAIVFFEGVGQKQLMLRFAKLTILED